MTPSGPNLVLVVVDTARADLVGVGRDTAFAQLGRRDVASDHPDVVARLQGARGRRIGDGSRDLAGGSVGGLRDGVDAEITAHLEGFGYL